MGCTGQNVHFVDFTGHRLIVMRTTDGGKSVRTFTNGLPQCLCFDLMYRHGLDFTQDGEVLAMGSTTGNLWVGERQGPRWNLAASHLPPIYAVAWG